MDPAVAALDIAKAGAILANMIESYLAGGAPPSNPEGADHDDLQDCRSTSVAPSLHLHSSVDDGAGPLQPGEHRAPVQSGKQGTVPRLELGANPDPRPGSRPVRCANDQSRGRHRQQVGLAFGQPLLGRCTLAFWAVPIATSNGELTISCLMGKF